MRRPLSGSPPTDKIIANDLHYVGHSPQLAMAMLSSLQGRHDEAEDWFVRARLKLDEQGARPMRAVVDFEEARALARRGAERGRAVHLLEMAVSQFDAIGMPGWTRNATVLRDSLARS